MKLPEDIPCVYLDIDLAPGLDVEAPLVGQEQLCAFANLDLVH